MLTWLASIQGRDFLWIYPVYATVIFILTKIWLRRTDAEESSLGCKMEPNPLCLIILSRPAREHVIAVLQYFLYKMWQEQRIVLEKQRERVVFATNTGHLASSGVVKSDSNMVEDTILDVLATPKTVDQLLEDRKVFSAIEDMIKKTKEQLIVERLYKNPMEIGEYKRGAALGLLLALVGGLAKLFLGLVNEKPVGFLVLELIAVTAVFLIFKWTPVLTEAGEAYVLASKKKYSRFSGTGGSKQRMNANDSRPFDDYFIPLSLYGAAYLSDDYQTAPFSGAFENNRRHIGGGDYGSGGSCSGNNSGGSCSGGGSGCSSGGGGCGGCGGS